jgi:hypothetical protein
MITKTFMLAKDIRAMHTKILRQNKTFRDHGAIPAGIAERVRGVVWKGRAGFEAGEWRAASAWMTAVAVAGMLWAGALRWRDGTGSGS